MRPYGIDVLHALARIMDRDGRTDDHALVLRYIADAEREAAQNKGMAKTIANLRSDIEALRAANERAREDAIKAMDARRGAFGDGVVVLRCGARVWVEAGAPRRVHEGEPHTEARDLRRSLALQELAAIWPGYELASPWGDEPEAAIDQEIPF